MPKQTRTRVRKQRYAVLLGIVLIGVLAGIFFARYAVPVLEPRGDISRQEKQLIIVCAALSLLIVIPVFSLVGFVVWKYRAGNKRARYAPEWDHGRWLETSWWLIPSVLIGVLAVITWRSTHELDPYKALAASPGHQALNVQVVALDWKWLFIYPDQHVASVNSLEVPVGRPVNFQLTADAPMNSFWIPQLGGQIYAMPGMVTELHLRADKAGDYKGASANISGKGFAGMKFVAHAVAPADFDGWVKQTQAAPQHLDMAAYSHLAQPSENNPPVFYSQPDGDLFTKIVSKYMSPDNSNNGGES